MYRRFLNNNDYLSIITETAINQLIRDDENRYIQAEQAAEASVVDYLSENYEIENELNRGKYIFKYDRKITYPIGSHFYLDGKICEVIKSINGYKSPSATEYWKESDEMVELDTIPRYSQMKNYHVGDKVVWLNVLYECIADNGFDFGDIRIPGIQAWQQMETYQWEAIPYNEWEVVEYNGQFFTLTAKDGYDELVNPMDSDCWGLIGNYDKTIDTYELSEHEYVVCDGKVFYPVINPNAETPVIEKNIAYHDPRNYNLKRHMVQLALYELHKLISPNNVSTMRVDDYNHSMQWLKDASRLKLNPQIPRKLDRQKEPVMEWQMATFQTSYDPYLNPWQV